MSIESRTSQPEQPNKEDRVLKHVGTALLALSGVLAAGAIYELNQGIENFPSTSSYETQEQYQIAYDEYQRQGYAFAGSFAMGTSLLFGVYGYGFRRMGARKDIIPEPLGRRMDRFLEAGIYPKDDK